MYYDKCVGEPRGATCGVLLAACRFTCVSRPDLAPSPLCNSPPPPPPTQWRKKNPRLPGSSPWFKTRWRGNWPLCATRSRASPTCLNRSRRRVEVSQCGGYILYWGARRAARQGGSPRQHPAGRYSGCREQRFTAPSHPAGLRHLRRGVGPNQPHACPPVDGIATWPRLSWPARSLRGHHGPSMTTHTVARLRQRGIGSGPASTRPSTVFASPARRNAQGAANGV